MPIGASGSSASTRIDTPLTRVRFAVTGSLSEYGRVRTVLTGGTGVLGRAAVRALQGAGHDVVLVTRSARARGIAERMGVGSVAGDVLDRGSLVEAFADAEVVVNLASAMPVGSSMAAPRAWRRHDRLRTTGVSNVVAAARRAGVRRLVQESVSSIYADGGDDWITEAAPLEITASTEPAAVGESLTQEFCCGSRTAVLLRFGQVVGDDPHTRHQLRAAQLGRRIGLGHPSDWAHVVHTDDVGTAVVAALHAPSGVYNVGAEPVQRLDLVQGYADAMSAASGSFRSAPGRWRNGPRYEPLTRSLRVCSEHFESQTGWRAERPKFDATWFDVVLDRESLSLR